MFDAENRPIDFSKHQALVGRNKYLVLTFCLSAAVSALILTYVFSEEYEAAVTILFRPNEATKFQPNQQQALGFPVPIVSLESIGNTLEEVAKTEAVVQRVVRELHLDKPPAKKPSTSLFIYYLREMKDWAKSQMLNIWGYLKYGRDIETDRFVDAVRRLQENLVVEPTKKAYTFRLIVTDSDPQRAAAIVDTEAEIITEFLKEDNVRVARQGKEGVESRLRQNEKEVAASRETLDRFKRQQRVSSLSEETTLQLRKIVDFEEELTRVENDLKAAHSRRDELENQLQKQQPYLKYSSTTTNNPIVQEMQSELARLELQRSGLMEKFTPEHQEIRAVEARIAEARERLATEEKKILSSESLQLNDVYQKISADVVSARTDVAALAAKQSGLKGTLSRLRGDLEELNKKQARLSELMLQLEVAERSFKLLSDAYEEARIAESKAVSEVAVLNLAIVPSAPVRPIKILHVGVAATLSLIFALGAVYLFAYFDPTLRRLDQVEFVLKLPVLATIPPMSRSELTTNGASPTLPQSQEHRRISESSHS